MNRFIPIAVVLFSIAIGYASEPEIPIPTRLVQSPCITEEQAALDARLTGIRPTCSELTGNNPPVARLVGSDWVLVVPDPEKGQYLVVGIYIPDSGSPVTMWQGAGLAGAIEQFCAEEVQD
jgi:hypothetical protein